MKVTPQNAGTITNQAAVTSDLADPDSADASASENTTVEGRRRPRAHQVRLARPGARRRADHLRAQREQRRAAGRHRRHAHRHAAGGVTFESATPTQGSCSESSGTVTCALGTIARPGQRRRRDQGAPLHARHDHQPGERHIRRTRPGLEQQLGERRDDRRTRPPTCRSRRPTRPTRCWPASCSPTRSPPTTRVPRTPPG